MKKMVGVLLVVIMTVTLVACGGKEKVKYDNSSLKSILSSVEEEFSVTTEYLESELDKVFGKMGRTCEEYIKNQDKLTEWYSLAQTETEELFEKTITGSNDYFELMQATVDMEDYEEVYEVMEEYYEIIVTDCLEEYYENLFYGMMEDIEEDIIDELYDAYNDGELRKKDYTPFEEMHEYVNESLMSSYEKLEKSLDKLIEKIEEEDDEVSEASSNDWEKFLEEYEEWIDDYIDIYQQYKEDPTDMDVLTEYTELAAEMVEWNTEAEELELEITDADEAIEYATELSRIVAKLAEVEY